MEQRLTVGSVGASQPIMLKVKPAYDHLFYSLGSWACGKRSKRSLSLISESLVGIFAVEITELYTKGFAAHPSNPELLYL
jgi:hypothetical protein